MNHDTVKNRSYNNRVARGDTVVFTAANRTAVFFHVDEDRLVEGPRLEPGVRYTGVVTTETNAGFRGIEMGVRLVGGPLDGGRVYGISTGLIARRERNPS